MNPTKVIIATAMIIFLSSFLNGCTSEKEVNLRESAGIKTIQLAKKIEKDVTMQLETERNDNQISVIITLDNPKQKSISSAQNWLGFNPNKLQGKKINVDSSPFTITAPYENNFDNKNGLVMIGRANNQPITDQAIYVAEVIFEIIETGTTMIEAYDYQDDLSGHTSVNILIDDIPYNVLVKPESPALVIQQNNGTTKQQSNDTTK